MGLLRRSLFRFVYPLPAKKEDPLEYKQKFIEEYTSCARLKMLFKIYFLSQLIKTDKIRKNYIKKAKDCEQKQHLDACKLYRQSFMKKRI